MRALTQPADIGTGGNVSLTTGGNLSADSMSVAINNRGGGVIGSGVNLTVNIGGALTTLHDGPDFIGNDESLSLAISSRYDNGTAGSFIGGDATLLFHSDSASIGGHLEVAISDRGGTIDGNALLGFTVTHDITVQGADITNQSAAGWEILNDSGDAQHAGTPIGGTIHGSATLLLSAANLTVPAGSLNVDILNKNGGVPGSGGTVDSDATIAFILTGDVTTQQDAFFEIQNQLQLTGTTGGTIGGNATVNVTAANFSVGGVLDVEIANSNNGSGSSSGGSIGGNAAVNFNADNNVSSGSAAYFQILNASHVAGSPGGFIGGDATIDVTAASISTAGALDAEIDNFSGGGNAGSIGGSIVGARMIYVTAANITANSLTATINNTGGSIGASTEAGAAINMNVSGTASVTTDATVAIYGSDGAVGGAAININGGNYNVGGTFFVIHRRQRTRLHSLTPLLTRMCSGRRVRRKRRAERRRRHALR